MAVMSVMVVVVMAICDSDCDDGNCRVDVTVILTVMIVVMM